MSAPLTGQSIFPTILDHLDASVVRGRSVTPTYRAQGGRQFYRHLRGLYGYHATSEPTTMNLQPCSRIVLVEEAGVDMCKR